MGVHRYAPVEALRGDMGWLSANSRHKISILNFWNRLCKIPEDRLTRRVFDWDRLYSNKRGTWSSAAKGILNEIGNSDNFIDASCCNIDYALSIISLHDDVDWEDKRFRSEKLRYYNLYKSEKKCGRLSHLRFNEISKIYTGSISVWYITFTD